MASTPKPNGRDVYSLTVGELLRDVTEPAQKRRDIVLSCDHQDVDIDSRIAVHDPVAHTHRVAPPDVGMLRPRLLADLVHRAP